MSSKPGLPGVTGRLSDRGNFVVVSGGRGEGGCLSPACCHPHQASPGYLCSVSLPIITSFQTEGSSQTSLPPLPPGLPDPVTPPCPQLPATVTPALALDAAAAGPSFTWGQTRLVATSRPGPCLPSRLSQRRPQPSQARCGAGCLGGTGGGGHAARSGRGEGEKEKETVEDKKQRPRGGGDPERHRSPGLPYFPGLSFTSGPEGQA